MGGCTGKLHCAALAEAHGVELPHQTQPTIGHTANLHLVARLPHMTKPCEWNDPSPRQHPVFENPPKPGDGLFHLPTSRVLVYKSTRPNWPSAASQSRNDYAPDNRSDERDGSFKVRLGNQ
jgi:L-alanine-DL-glutamate epimerase-like enolase superfamily enzyme